MITTKLQHEPIRILLVEDYDLVRQGLELLLRQYPDISIVGGVGTLAEALQLADQEKPDVVLLDLVLGEENGLAVLPEILEKGAKNVIVFTGTSDAELHRNALALGAKAVIEKGQSEEYLADCIRRVHHGETLQYELEAAKIARLSQAEREVVALLCAGVKDEGILGNMGMSPPELANTIASAQTKLGVDDTVNLVVYAFRHGLARAGATE